jgi:alkaline phosphatase
MFARLVLALSLSIALSVSAAPPTRPKSIIFVIGDGMGPAHFTATQLLRGDESKLSTMPVTGLVITECIDSPVTDSAAAATSLACGVKTKYRAVGVDGEGRPIGSVLEAAEKLGKSTGLVTTANFWDATPAAFAAHTASRYSTAIIIGQMLSSGVEIIVGGGSTQLGTKGLDTLPVLAARHKYATAQSLGELQALKGNRILGVFPTQKNEVDVPGAPLPQLASWAIEELASDKDGFFIMIEHEGPDGSSHNNDTLAFEASVRSFDETVNVALEFASRNPDVLVLVTGDHETGGLQVAPEKIGGTLEFKWATGSHTGEMIPIFAKGPGAESFMGLMYSSDVGKRLKGLVETDASRRRATVTLRR